jgi:WD40 repeat protein
LPDHGIRALKISSDGSLLATGDRKGNLRVHRISDWQEVTYLEAHDSEILTIDFSTPTSNGKLIYCHSYLALFIIESSQLA